MALIETYKKDATIQVIQDEVWTGSCTFTEVIAAAGRRHHILVHDASNTTYTDANFSATLDNVAVQLTLLHSAGSGTNTIHIYECVTYDAGTLVITCDNNVGSGQGHAALIDVQ